MNGIRLEAVEWPIHSQPYGMQPRLAQGDGRVVRICGSRPPSIYPDPELRRKYAKNPKINCETESRREEGDSRREGSSRCGAPGSKGCRNFKETMINSCITFHYLVPRGIFHGVIAFDTLVTSAENVVSRIPGPKGYKSRRWHWAKEVRRCERVGDLIFRHLCAGEILSELRIFPFKPRPTETGDKNAR